MGVNGEERRLSGRRSVEGDSHIDKPSLFAVLVMQLCLLCGIVSVLRLSLYA